MPNVLVICLTIFATISVWAGSLTKIISLGETTIDQSGKSAPISVDIPSLEGQLKTVSALIMVSGDNCYRYEINFLSENQKFNINEKTASGVPGTGSILIPNDPNVAFQTGTWQFEIIGKPVSQETHSAKVKVDLALKFADAKIQDSNFRGKLKINFVFVAPRTQQVFEIKKLEEIMTHLSDYFRRPRFRDGKAYRSYLYSQVKVDETTGKFTMSIDGRKIPITAENEHYVYFNEILRFSRDNKWKTDLGIDFNKPSIASVTYSGPILTKNSLDNGGLNQLLIENAKCRDCLNVFIIHSILMSDAGVNGYSTGQPGHFGMAGGLSSGIVAFVNSNFHPVAFAGTLAHEIGHYLGLPHEEFSRRFSDVDMRGNNLMQTLGSPDGRGSQGFTPQQMLIMLAHPLLSLD